MDLNHSGSSLVGGFIVSFATGGLGFLSSFVGGGACSVAFFVLVAGAVGTLVGGVCCCVGGVRISD
jgi:hypothetical protein